MNQFYTLSILFILGFSLPLCGQNGLQFDWQEEQVQSVVFTSNSFPKNTSLAPNFKFKTYQYNNEKSGAAAFFIWTGAGLTAGFLTGYIMGISQGDSHDNTKENYAMIYGYGLAMLGGGVGAIIGLGHALSISNRQPKEKPVFKF